MKKNKCLLFTLFTLFTFSIFAQEKLTSSLTETKSGSTWVNYNRSEYKYDSNNNLTEETQMYWDTSTFGWKNSSKMFYNYNTNNKATEFLYQNFDFDNNISYQYKTTYTYNTAGDLIEFIDEEWNGSAWEKSYKLELVYSGSIVSSGVNYEWTGTDWGFGEYSSNVTINYNGNGTISSSVADIWNGTNWVTSDRTIFTYDGNNNLILQDGQVWDGTNWSSDNKLEKTYDSNGNAITEKESYLENGSFVVALNETNNFDTSALMSNFSNPFKDKTGIDFIFSGNGIVNKILNKTGVNTRTTYNYGEQTASVNDFNAIDFSIYPNPTSSIIKINDSNFSIKNVELYSILGKKVMTSTKNKLNLQNLVNGVYLLKIETESGEFAAKRIIKK